jgi:Domain of unknown function (DUF4232)
MRRTRTLVAGIVAAIVMVAALPTAFAALHAAQAPPPDCLRSQLGVRSNGTQGAAGTIYGAWVFTNRSKTACNLNGYPGIQLFGKQGRPIPTHVSTDLTPGPTDVALASGDSATFRTSYSDVSSGGKCTMSSVMQITAPNAAASLFIPAGLGPCEGVVHVSAVRAGVHHA